MSQEYYKLEQESKLGLALIGMSVFESIVEKVVEPIEGVELSMTSGLVLQSKPIIQCKLDELSKIVISFDVAIDYGLKINAMMNKIQMEIRDEIINLTGLKQCIINININNINFQ